MKAVEHQLNNGRNFKRGGNGHCCLLCFLKCMVVVSILLPTFALPTVWAEEVPDVVSLTQADAEAAISAAGLTVGTITPTNHPTVAAGTVISHTPGAGASVAAGSAVDLVVSTGPVLVTVPNVVGLAQADAEAAISAAGLTVGTITPTNHPTVAAGTVISHTPGAGASVAAGSAVDLVVSTGPVLVTVPNVVGLAQADAEAAISAAGLTVGTITPTNHPTVAAGTVISHTPGAGASVAGGSAVDLVVSTGPVLVTVPNVVGLAQADAEAAISAAGLTVGTITPTNHPTVAAGTVISHTPGAGASVAGGSAVALVVSTGPAPVTVPNVVGLTQAAAQTALTNAGLTVGTITTTSHASVASGRVISHTPGAGASVAGGSAVALVVSTGPAPVTVPNVVGLTQAAAQTALTNAGLTVGTITTTSHASVASGRVISHTPGAGASVAGGSAVALVVSTGPAPVTVPNVVGLTQAAAQTALTNAGLTVGTITTTSHASVASGRVISHTPGAGASVAGGSAVALVVSTGPAPVTVPNVVGLTQAAAQTALTKAGLTVGTVTSTNSQTVPIGRVISQSPAPGTNVAGGSPVNLVVSLGITVPNVVGLTQAAAQTTLTNAGLTVGTITTTSHASVASGRVISHTPAAGASVGPNTAVALVMSNGPAVPNVVGLTQAAAQTALTKAGLKVGTVTSTNSQTVPIGRVISQSPAPGTNVAGGSAVNLVVSLGITVPNVVGLTQAAAQTALINAGLKVGAVTTATSPKVAIGDVISQNPPAGSNVAAGSVVDLLVSLGTQVPNVVGLAQAAAQTVITNAGLTVGIVTTAISATVPIGDVIGQKPGAGSNVNPGSAVALVISSGPPVFLMGVQNDPKTGPLVNSLYRLRTDGVVTKIGNLTHRTHGLAFVGTTLYSVEELSLSPQPGAPLNLYRLNPESGASLDKIPLALSTGESVEGGRGLATEPGTKQLWGLLVVRSEANSIRRLVTINPTTGIATQKAKLFGNFMDLAFDAAGTLYAITDNRPVPRGATVLPARIYRVNKSTGATTEFLDVSSGAVAGQSNFRESETIGVGPSSDLMYHLSGQHKVTSGFTKNILFETIHLNNMARTAMAITGPDFFVTTALTLVPPTSPPALGDLDASGTADLIWRNQNDGSTAIWLMNGTTIAASGFPGGVPRVWQIAGMGDVNGDGKADVIWRNGPSGTVAVWLMNGVSVTTVGFPGSTSKAFEIAGVGDVNGDGKADLFWRNATDGSTAIWLMNGTAIAASGFPGGVPLAWQIEGVGDVNGDGKSDVIWRNGISGGVAIWLMNGVSVTAVGFVGVAPTTFEIAGVGDVNGDGKTDLVWRNQSDGSTAIWFMNGTAIATAGFPGGVPLAWQISQVGDVNGDGNADVIWRNDKSAIVAVWLMNGLSISTVGFPGSAPSDWEIQ